LDTSPEPEAAEFGSSSEKVPHAQNTQAMHDLLQIIPILPSIGKRFKKLATAAWAQPDADKPLIASLILTFAHLRKPSLIFQNINMDLTTVDHGINVERGHIDTVVDITKASKYEVINAINLALEKTLSCGIIQSPVAHKKWWDGRNDYRWHGRSHPKDFSFPGIFGGKMNHERPTGPPHLVFALAMHWGSLRDRVRLQMMLNLCPGTQIISVSETEDTVGNLLHLNSSFKCLRGIRNIARAVTQYKIFPGQRVTVILDYFWLASKYYTTNYGEHWLTSTALLLAAGVDRILLPNDNGRIHQGESIMKKMLVSKIHNTVSVEFVTFNQNPLWVASNHDEISGVLAEFDCTNKQMTADFVCPANPFVEITLNRQCVLKSPKRSTKKRAKRSTKKRARC